MFTPDVDANGIGVFIIGRTDNNAAMTLNAHTWNSDLHLKSGTGAIVTGGVQDVLAHNLTVETDGAVNLTGGFTGTGRLTMMTADINKNIGLAGAAGDLTLNTASLNALGATWGSMVFGRGGAGTNSILMNAYGNWSRPVNLRSGALGLTA